ncbi:hypothetical protein Vadar_025403 [Vaccinium darrowii]|uniref:Uncharacterized protein n=1 Tax=Vaccinium darrowii TaxID=229202 RepID=A0ACB7X3V5_9ERIC|nr:hypothetical protein Vadar_025403 [Vaccinium darrowii]
MWSYSELHFSYGRPVLPHQSPPHSFNAFTHQLLVLPTTKSLASPHCPFHCTHRNDCKISKRGHRFPWESRQEKGLGSEACMLLAMHEIPPDSSLKSNNEEIESPLIFTVVKTLFCKHNVDPKTIDILMSNGSLFCSTPSITATIINKLRGSDWFSSLGSISRLQSIMIQYESDSVSLKVEQGV